MAASLAALPDGGLVVAGNAVSQGAGGQDMWVLRLNEVGDVVWERTFGGSEDDVEVSVVPLPNGGLALAGSTNSKGAGKQDMWMVRLDSAGNVVWERAYGGSEDDLAWSVEALPGGGLGVAGFAWSKGAGGADIWILRLDDAGNVVWVG